MRVMLCAAVLAVAVAGLRAGEEKVALDKLPKAVGAAVAKRFPKAELIEAAKETVGDKVEYEVTVKDGGTKIDVTLTPDGKVTVIEKAIAAKDLPKAVSDALDAKYAKAKYTTVEEVTKVKDGKEALAYYEVLLVTQEKKTLEVEVTGDGKIAKTTDKTAEKKEVK